MADNQEHAANAHGADAHHGPDFGAYMTVFAALGVFTIASFIINQAFGAGNLTGAGLIMLVAVIKAFLVGMIFMHLKYDWPNLYFLIAPSFILAAMMVIVLLPDIVLAWHNDPFDQPVAKKKIDKSH